MLLDKMASVVGQAHRLLTTLFWQATRLPYNSGALACVASHALYFVRF
jgi:hypothetical protein